MTKPTELHYLQDMSQLTCDASILDIIHENERDIIILDQTVIYPQGGGQPYDIGGIKSQSATFNVEEVRMIDGIVKHIGTVTNGKFTKNDRVSCHVDEAQRLLNSRLHAAGHLIDMAVHQLKLNWTPQKGHHFPRGAYVEYHGDFDASNKENIQKQLESQCKQIIQEGSKTNIRFVPPHDLKHYCHFMPDYVSQDKPVRLIFFGKDFATPCGGTHVDDIAIIQAITIRKLKMEKGNIRVSYDILQDIP